MKFSRKKRYWLLALMAVILIISVAIERWDIWFFNPQEPAYSAQQEPYRIQLTFGKKGEYSRIITWQCGDTLQQAHIDYSLLSDSTHHMIEATGCKLQTNGGITICYQAELNDLQPGATYVYQVVVGDKSSEANTFTVPAFTDSAFRVIYIADIQDTINGSTATFFNHIVEHYPSDFWIFGGDLIERPHDQYWAEYFQSVSKFSPSIPMLAVAGNHEYRKGVPVHLEERFVKTFPNLKQENKAYATFDMRYGNTAFIFLDSNRDIWQLFAQRCWLKQALERAENAQFKVVVLHHPPYSIRGKWNNSQIRWLFLPLLEAYGVDLVLAGHEHAYARKLTKIKEISTIPLFVISNVSPKDYSVERLNNYSRLGTGQRYFQTIDIKIDTLTLEVFTERFDLYDKVQIIKNNGTIQVKDFGINWEEHFSGIQRR